jgi:hypothetical protein
MKEDLQKTFNVWGKTYCGSNKICRKISAVIANSIHLKGILLSPKNDSGRTKPKPAATKVLTTGAQLSANIY